ncbi:MAG: sugar phosphate isomerase/epimerase [Verrucomicrobiota bacterium]|nr:sugar phosphate isomerase/epimerase [Verrucomicrobiota bacterium]
MPIACSTAIGCGFPIEEALNRIVKTGLHKCDLLTIEGWAHLNPSSMIAEWDATTARVDALLMERNLRLVSLNAMIGTKMHERTPAAMASRERETAAVLEFMSTYGISTIALQPPLKWQETWSDAEQDLCIATLREQMAVAQKAGVTFALELHTRSPFESMQQVNRLLAALPEIPLVYDATHFVMQGIPIRETAWMMKNAAHAHLRDAKKGELQAPYGEGEVDFDWVLGTLQEKGFKGTISIEYLGSKDTPFDVVDSASRLADKISEYFAV